MYTIWSDVVIGFGIAYVSASIVSFLMLLGMRIPRGEDWVSKSSRCEVCDRNLGYVDLMPIFSYIFLGGKCRGCKTPYGKKYFLYELITFTVVLILYMWFGLNYYTLGIVFGWFLAVPYLMMITHYEREHIVSYVKVFVMVWILYIVGWLVIVMS